jgi:signal transduction histidine kinase
VSDKERARVAADLHDGPIQDLAGVTYALDAVSLTVKDEHRPLMRDVQDTVTHAVWSLRKLMIDLYPPDLSADQLPSTIANLAVTLRDRGVDVQIDVQPLPDLDNDTVTTIYRVAREAMMNIVEHSGAEQVRISLRVANKKDIADKKDVADKKDIAEEKIATDKKNSVRSTGTGGVDGDVVQLIIADDGVGLDPDRVNRREEGHLGLRLLIDRVEDLGGVFTLSSPPAGGTTVCAVLPISAQLTDS